MFSCKSLINFYYFFFHRRSCLLSPVPSQLTLALILARNFLNTCIWFRITSTEVSFSSAFFLERKLKSNAMNPSVSVCTWFNLSLLWTCTVCQRICSNFHRLAAKVCWALAFMRFLRGRICLLPIYRWRVQNLFAVRSLSPCERKCVSLLSYKSSSQEASWRYTFSHTEKSFRIFKMQIFFGQVSSGPTYVGCRQLINISFVSKYHRNIKNHMQNIFF